MHLRGWNRGRCGESICSSASTGRSIDASSQLFLEHKSRIWQLAWMVTHIHVSQHEKGPGFMNSWTTAMRGNVRNPGLWIKQERMCGGYGKDGPTRVLARKGRSTMIGTFGSENRLRDEILGWLKLISLDVGAWHGWTPIYES
ncbi:hypothetical protein V8C42DRAFT_153996 [Trichoderma barbatum]